MHREKTNSKKRSAFLEDYYYRRKWKLGSSVLSVLVVISTISSLILPAITLNNTACGMEEHIHGDSCRTVISAQIQNCTLPELNEHRHEGGCFDADGATLLCRLQEVIPHIHDDTCYVDGILNCGLEELILHRHDESCYTTQETETLICTLTEHTHTDECKAEESLSEEEQSQVDELIVLIDALPVIDEVNTQLNAYTEAKDEAGRAAYTEKLTAQVLPAFEQYNAMGEAQKAAVTNAARLMALKWLTETDEPRALGEDEKLQLQEVIDHIAALPEAETLNMEDLTALQEAKDKAQVARNLYNALSADLQEQVDIGKLAALEALFESNTPAPSPSPTTDASPTPTPDASPTPTPDVSPSPTPDVSPSPEVSPSPSPEVSPAPEETAVALDEEAQQQVDDVISLIEMLPSAVAIEDELSKYKADGDTDGLAAYSEKILNQIQWAFDDYNALSDEQKAAVTNADYLMEHEYLIEILKENIPEDEPDYVVTAENVTAEVSREGDDLPEGTQFVMEPVSAEAPLYTEAWMAAEDELLGRDELLQDMTLLELHFADADGNELAVSGPTELTLSFAQPIPVKGDRVFLLHFGSLGLEEIPCECVRGESGVSSVTFTANSFSGYALASANENIGEALDGDYAYLSDVELKSYTTGTAPWDADDGPGNDSGTDNDIIRTFDTASYTVTLTSRVREGSPHTLYKQGKLYFEFILPGDSAKIQFEPGSMNWLAAKNATYAVTEETVDGVTSQVLRGWYLSTPAEGYTHSIGEATQELSLVLRVFAMCNGDTITPRVTFFLEHNDIGADLTNWGTADYSGGCVTELKAPCAVHGEAEAQTVSLAQLTVSARLMVNVVANNNGENSLGKSTRYSEFDFNTGNDFAPYRDWGLVEGRMFMQTFQVYLCGKGGGQGLRGLEFPMPGSEFSFDVQWRTKWRTDKGVETDVTERYPALLWDVGPSGDSAEIQRSEVFYQRELWDADDGVHRTNNAGATLKGRYCHDGGLWSGQMNGDVLTLTVEDWETEPEYNYDWESFILTSCRLVMVQPFFDKQGNTNSGGEYRTTAYESNLRMISTGGTECKPADNDTSRLNNQTNVNDDQRTSVLGGVGKGSWSRLVYHMTHNGISHVSGYNSHEWRVKGETLRLRYRITHSGAEENNTGVGYDLLLKFDDNFVMPDAILGQGFNEMSVSKLWAVKPDGTGWDHKGLKPDEEGYDDEMRNTGPADLLFMSGSSQDVMDKGYTIVGALAHIRGLSSDTSALYTLDITCLQNPDVETGYVYMVSPFDRVWTRGDLAKACAASEKYSHLGLTEILEMSKEEIDPIIDELIVSIVDSGEGYYTYNEDVYSTVTTRSSTTWRKNVVGPGGFTGGHGLSGLGGSCLVVPYLASAVVNSLQTTPDGSTKTVFDMDTYQRVVDYNVRPNIWVSALASDEINIEYVTETITLPKGLTYLEGSSYIGAENYIQNGEGVQGSYTGGAYLSEGGTLTCKDGSTVRMSVTKNADGTTTLIYTFSNVPFLPEKTGYTGLQRIRFSAFIGTPGNEDTDVKNQEQLTINVKSTASGDTTPLNNAGSNDNIDYAISVSKLNAINLSKFADQDVVDPGAPMGFSMNIGNSGNNTMDILAVDGLPWSGDGASRFTGACRVTEFSVQNPTEMDMSRLSFYYTTDINQRGKKSADYLAANESFSDSSVWIPLSMNADGTAVIPASFEPVAIVVKGSVPAGTSLKLHLTLLLPDGKGGDYAVNNFSNNNLATTSRCRVAMRTLEGCVWIDSNHNGLRESNEPLLNGVGVRLYKMNEAGKYEVIKNISTGRAYDLVSEGVSSCETGYYRFTNLTEGTYRIWFFNETTIIKYYYPSPLNAGSDSIDSDAVVTYYTDKGKETMIRYAEIDRLVMPAASTLSYGTYTSSYNDFGLYAWGAVLPDTGGAGDYMYMFSGWAMVSVALALIYRSKQKKRKGES